MTEVSREHIEIVEGAGGPKPRIAGHRVRVQDVAIWHEKLGTSPDEIVHHYPTLTLADVHAALAYYWDHREEIEGAIAEEHARRGGGAPRFFRAAPGEARESPRPRS